MKVFNLMLKLLRSNMKIIMVYFLVFIGMTFILVNVNKSPDNSSGFTGESLNIGVIDNDNAEYSKGFTEYFSAEHTLTPAPSEEDDILEGLYWCDYDYVITIPEGFSESIINPDIPDMELMSMQVPGYMGAVFFESELKMLNSKLSILLSSGYSYEEAFAEIVKNQSVVSDVDFPSFVATEGNDTSVVIFQFMPYFFLAAGVIGIGIIMIRINSREVKARTECGALSHGKRTLGEILGILFFGLIMFLVAILISVILSGGSVFSDPNLPLFLINMLAILAFALSAAFFAGSIANSTESINGIVNVISLALCFLGGVFVPQEYMSEGILNIAKFTPTYWYIKNINDIRFFASANSGFYDSFLKGTGIILLEGTALLLITLVIRNARRKRA